MGYAMYYTMGGTAPARTGASHATIAPYGPYRTARRPGVIFGIQNNREWDDVLPLRAPTGRNWRRTSDFRATTCGCSTARRWTPKSIEASRRCRTAEVRRRLDAAQIANARLNTVAAVHRPSATRRPRRVAAGRLGRRPDPRTRSAGPHGRRRAQDGCRFRRSVSTPTSILAELGFDTPTIERWQHERVI